jgi:glycosyltransferase involved in cell wall biosynthesis
MTDHRWTISILTIPQRESYVKQLVESLADARLTRQAALSIVYNWDSRESPAVVERRLRALCGRVPVDVSFNTSNPTIVSGRNQQLNACKTPLICFLDDDVTVSGDLLGAFSEALRREPLGIVGARSFVGSGNTLFKPRESTPFVDRAGTRFMSVQGMAVGGYRRLFLDIGSFNPRRRFWGEWTELNLRMWRSGFPTGYVMEGPFLRHWHDAPESPTRNRTGREVEVLWGLMCTALEYDAVEITRETETFWRLVAERYLAYSFGPDVTPQLILSAMLGLVPRLMSEMAHITEFRESTRKQRFQFAPFANLTRDDVNEVIESASSRIDAYRNEAWPEPLPPSRIRRFFSGRWRAVQSGALP